MDNIIIKAQNATKWSFITEISSKIVAPVTNIFLARILTPDAFGMVATVTMIISFADIFTDAGFQKYLVQYDFSDEQHKNNATNIAFWTNLSISLILLALIGIFRHSLADMVGNPGLGNAFLVASISLPLNTFSSIQTALLRRDFDFKTLFYARIIGICIPFFVTIPLAFITKSFWALIIGTLATNLSNVIMLTIRSLWRPKLYYSIDLMREMFGFSIWTLIERMLGWANLNIGIFIIGRFLSPYYLGVFKISMATVNQIMAVVTNSLSPVLLSSLSRLKGDENEYKKFFYSFEKMLSILILPLGIGIFLYRGLITSILLGSQWIEASNFIGLWALMRSLLTVFGMFSMEVFVSLGKPRYSVLSQTLELVVLIPTLLVSASKGYNMLYIARSLVVFASVIINMALLKHKAKISSTRILKDVTPYAVASLLMGAVGYCLKMISNNIIWQFFSIVLCIILYFVLLCVYPKTRSEVIPLIKKYVYKVLIWLRRKADKLRINDKTKYFW